MHVNEIQKPTKALKPDIPDWLIKAPRYCPDPHKAALSVTEVIDAHADEAERVQYLPETVVRAVAGAGLYGMFVPKEFGGAEPSPEQLLDAIAELSYADGSTGWAVMACVFNVSVMYARGSDVMLDAVFNSKAGFIGAGQISTLGRGDRAEGGLQVSGLFHFGSGSRESSWFMGAFVEHADGKPVIGENGALVVKLAFAPREKINLKGNWDVLGLAATASYDFEFPEQFVSEHFVTTMAKRRGSALYSIGVALGHAAWAVGVARRVLDELRNLAKRKQRFNRQTLIDQPIFQRDFALHRGMLAASEDNLRRTFMRHFDLASKGKDGQDIRVDCRLAACWAVEVAVRIGQFAYLAAGSDALRNMDGKNRLQRCFRDIHAGSQHRHTDHNTIGDCGTVLLGVAKPDLAL